MSNKVTNKDAMNAIRAFTEQSEKNIAFGTLADTENGNFSTFIKGEELEILAMITMQMATTLSHSALCAISAKNLHSPKALPSAERHNWPRGLPTC